MIGQMAYRHWTWIEMADTSCRRQVALLILALFLAVGTQRPVHSAIQATPLQTAYANLWFPRDATHLLYTKAADAALYYNLVDWQPGYVERSNCRLISAGSLASYTAMTAPFGLSYTYTHYTSECTDRWGGPRHGTVIQIGPIFQCPPNSGLTGTTCTCSANYAEVAGSCVADAGTPEPEPGQMCHAGSYVGHPIFPATGEKVLTQTDYSGNGPHALDFMRHFRSGWVNGTGRPVGDGLGLGQSWSHNHAASLSISGTPSNMAQVRFGDGRVSSFNWDNAQLRWVSATGSDGLVQSQGGLRLSRTEDDSQWQFDATGRLGSVTRRNGRTNSYEYSDSATPYDQAPRAGLLLRVRNQFGRVLALGYDSGGQLRSVTTPDGQTTGYQFDTAHRLVSVVYPGSATLQYLYENPLWPNAVTGIIDERGLRLASYTYDAQGRAVSTEHGDGADRYLVAYGSSPTDPVQVTDPLGTQRNYRYGTTRKALVVTSASLPTGAGGADAANRIQNDNGLVDSETDFLGVRTDYAWEGQRRLLLSTTRAANRAEAQTSTTQWHPQWHLPVLVTEPGRSIGTSYDAIGNPVAETVTDTATGATRTTSWTHNAQGLLATSTNAAGGVTTWSYDAFGNLTRLLNPLQQATSWTYDAAGRQISRTDPGGLVTSFGYDARGRLVSQATGGEVTALTYTGSGQIESVSLPNGHVLRYRYDAAQRLIEISDNRGTNVRYVLDGMGNRVREETVNTSGTVVHAATRTIDPLNRVATLGDAIGQTTTMGFDANGEQIIQTDPLSNATRVALDALRRPAAITFADNNAASIAWSALNQVGAATDPKGVQTQYTRNAWGEVVRESSPDIGNLATVRDTNGQAISFTDALGRTTRISRDALGMPTRVLLPGTAGTQEFSYDAAGRPRLLRDGNGLTALNYDTLGRPIWKSQTRLNPGSTPIQHRVSYAYHPAGTLAQITYPSGLNVFYRISAQGQINAIDVQLPGRNQPVQAFIRDLTHTALGQPAMWSWTSGDRASREFDQSARMTRNEFAAYSYDPSGRVTGIAQTLWSNPAQPTTTAAATSTSPVPTRFDWTVQYDRRNRIVGFGRNGTNTRYTYDANSNRVTLTDSVDMAADLDAMATTSDYQQSLQQNLQIDSASNRLLGVTQVVSKTGGATNSSSTSTGNFALDAAGNLLSYGTRRFEYNGANRLSKTTNSTMGRTAHTHYSHNAMGQRVFKTEPVQETAVAGGGPTGSFFLWLRRIFPTLPFPAGFNSQNLGNAYIYGDGPLGQHTLLGEYGTGGMGLAPGNEIIWLPIDGGLAMPIGLVSAQRLYAVHADHILTPRLITNDRNLPVWQWPYSAFGDNRPTGVLKSIPDPRPGQTADQQLLRATTPALLFNLRYPGQYFDEEAGLNYNYFRSYQAATGRYTQPDPIGLAGGWNTTEYALANPLAHADPMGLDVNVCFFADAAFGFGHVGFGLPGEVGTRGFYPTGNPLSSPGKISPDAQKERNCKIIGSPPEKDQCMLRCRARWTSTPENYKLASRQCTSFVRDCLSECSLPTGHYSGPRPNLFFQGLPGRK